ncbi:helix-turn-helix domain-containing protein [Brenneria goodwinii]|nr:helix-turn-helix domain-containing protein [Brenneria goodwinii]MCG8155168.1 helix-turn-helix domain-containing protein [Brenneria goodwinii]MCG8159412.1 helix-turn-helix domain-containing protein [Brenneria goodwinii]MCG8164419.1 helix-turn-helix domain-containing protein [Brenneria goodwinii]MCG8169015.1 helix-turn-helix domain-containing protein [Brenneria goodwinii]MCG8173271.1 helix-turn-helix domain-containing protein [Brenneria goodwinii]
MTIKNPDNSLVSRLTELNNKGLSKSDMARVANVSKQAVTGWFRTGTISKASALAVAEAGGVSVAWLLGENVDEGSGLKTRERQMLDLFRQLPESEQDRMIDLFQVRLREIDEYVEKYLRGRFKQEDDHN